MAVKLTKVDIGENRYFHKFKKTDGTEEVISTTKTVYENLATNIATRPSLEGYTYLHSWSTIGFTNTSRDLKDGEYATQANGAQWVRIAGYPTTKLAAGYINASGFLSDIGKEKIIQINNNE